MKQNELPVIEFGEGMPAIVAGMDGPAKGAYALTPNDNQDIGAGLCRSLYVGTGGDITLDTEWQLSVLFKSVPSGFVLPVRVKRVKSTGTTASNIVALY